MTTIMKPKLKGKTKTYALIECNFLNRLKTQNKKITDQFKKRYCHQCGYFKSAEKKGLHLVCLYPNHPQMNKFLEKIKSS